MIDANKRCKLKSAKGASINDVAKAAGVSLGTVSRIFNGCENVDKKLRKQVWLVARNVGYMPKCRVKSVGIVCERRADGSSLGYVNVMRSLLVDAFMKKSFVVELIDADHLEQAYQSRVNGIAGVVFDDRLAELVRIPNLPVFAVNCDMSKQGINSIFADHFEQGYMATSHFIKFNHKRAGFLSTDPSERGCAMRIAGCRAAFKEHGLPEEALLVESTLSSAPYDILTRWIARNIRAIFNFSDNFAFETLHILSNVLNLRIGKDVSVISMEDMPVYNFMHPPQTTIRQPLEEIAQRTADKLSELIESPEGKLVCDRLGSKLVDRDSVAFATCQEKP